MLFFRHYKSVINGISSITARWSHGLCALISQIITEVISGHFTYRAGLHHLLQVYREPMSKHLATVAIDIIQRCVIVTIIIAL